MIGDAGFNLNENTVLQIIGNLIIQPLESHQHHRPHPPSESQLHLNQSELLAFRRSRDWRRDDRHGNSQPHDSGLSSHLKAAHHEKGKNKFQVKVDLEAKRKQQKTEEAQSPSEPKGSKESKESGGSKEQIQSIKERLQRVQSLLQGTIDRARETGEALKETNFQLIQKVTEQDETLNKRIDMLSKFNEDWRKDNHQELSQEIQQLKEEVAEEGEELRRRQQEFEKEFFEEIYNCDTKVDQMMRKIIEREKESFEAIRGMEIYYEETLKTRVKEEMKRVQGQFKREYQSLEDRVFLRLKEEFTNVSDMSWEPETIKEKENEQKVPLIEATRIFLFGKGEKQESEKGEKSEKSEKSEKVERVEKMEKLRESVEEKLKEENKFKFTIKMGKNISENLVDLTTPYAKNFRTEANTITLVKEEWKDDKKIYNQQVLLNVVLKKVFAFSARILKTKRNALVIGIVDRKVQKEEMDSFASGNAICYSGFKGRINYGESGEWRYKDIGDPLCEGVEVKVVASMDERKVTFTLKYPDKSVKSHSISSDILVQPQREFVPFFQMIHSGDTLEWFIE